MAERNKFRLQSCCKGRVSGFDRMMPRAVDLICGMKIVSRQRQRVVPFAHGDVVEIGFGSGLNLPHYDWDQVRSVTGINPDDGLPRLGWKAIEQQEKPIELLVESAEAMSLSDQSADSVVVTYSLCSIPNVEVALSEARRILKPNGKFFFCEHGLSPRPLVASLQYRLTPPWRWMASGCHLNRDIGTLVRAAGFEMENYNIYDLGFGSRIFGTHHVGSAVKR